MNQIVSCRKCGDEEVLEHVPFWIANGDERERLTREYVKRWTCSVCVYSLL